MVPKYALYLIYPIISQSTVGKKAQVQWSHPCFSQALKLQRREPPEAPHTQFKALHQPRPTFPHQFLFCAAMSLLAEPPFRLGLLNTAAFLYCYINTHLFLHCTPEPGNLSQNPSPTVTYILSDRLTS